MSQKQEVNSAWAQVEEIYRDRLGKAKEYKGKDGKLIGYLCSFTPVEMITAADAIPYRITGNMREPITLADAHLETIACPFTRSCLDMALKGNYDCLDGFVVPHACDNIVKLYDIWVYNIKHPYAHFVNVPHTLSKPSLDFFAAELATFKKSLERFTGKELTVEKLTRAIEWHNEQRALVRELFQLRKHEPPLISGAEAIKAIAAVTAMPVYEGNKLIYSLIKESQGRYYSHKRKATRLMICGTGNEEPVFVEAVEESGAHVVIDDLCFGTKPYWFEVSVSTDLLGGIARSYLERLNCPRTYRQSPGSHKADLESRFGYIYELARDFRAKAVILYITKYCDTHSFDAPDLKEFLRKKGLPVLEIEGDYPLSALAGLKTRVQAFLEMIA